MPKFTQDQRRDLDTLGVTAAQIDELETVALPISRAWLGSSPTLTDVRKELQALSDAMTTARDAMLRLLEEVVQTSAQREAADRALEAIYKMGGNGEVVKKALEAVVLMHGAVESATLKMPQEERRNRAASMIPVRAIDEALMSGFVKHRSTIHVIEEHVIKDPKKNNPWAYRIKVSSSPGSPFRQIVGICYEAMNQENVDPEKAIRAYVAYRKALKLGQHGGLESDLLAEAEAAGDPEARGELDEAADWLGKLLADGDVDSKEIRSEAKQAGIAWRTVERAKARLGVKVSKASFSGAWRWSLAKTAKGANLGQQVPKKNGLPS